MPLAPERLPRAPDPPLAREGEAAVGAGVPPVAHAPLAAVCDRGDAAVAALAAVCVLSILAYGRPPLPTHKNMSAERGCS